MYDPELNAIFEETDNPLEAFLAALIYYIAKIVFGAAEVVMDATMT